MRRKKRKRRKPENEIYQIAVEDWEIFSSFGVHLSKRPLDPGDYSEHSCLKLLGKLVHPTLKNIAKARINLFEEPIKENHWKGTVREAHPKSIGLAQILNDNVTLDFICSVPPRIFKTVLISASAGKVTYAEAFGEKLKWRKGLIFRISLSTTDEDD